MLALVLPGPKIQVEKYTRDQGRPWHSWKKETGSNRQRNSDRRWSNECTLEWRGGCLRAVCRSRRMLVIVRMNIKSGRTTSIR